MITPEQHVSRMRALRDCALGLFCGVLFTVAMIALCAFATGCTSTVTPAPVAAQSASYDEGEATSGLIALVPGGAIITEHARTRYNALIGVYGGEFLPALTPDRGVTVATVLTADPAGKTRQTYFITNEALEKFRLMNLWRRMGRAPSAKK